MRPSLRWLSPLGIGASLGTVACSSDPIGSEFPPTHHAQIEGTVRTAQGAPVAGVRVSAFSETSGYSMVTTRQNGTFRLTFGPHRPSFPGTDNDDAMDTVTVAVYVMPASGLHRDSVLAVQPAFLTFRPVSEAVRSTHLDLIALPRPAE